MERDRGPEAYPVRQPAMRPPRPTGRHRRPVPVSLPQSAPALVLAVPGKDTDLSAGPVAELAAVLRVDNPAVEVRAARMEGGGPDDPSDLQSVLADATDLIARFGLDAAEEAASRADRSRDLGNVVHFCRWRQVERLVVLLTADEVIGTVH